MKTRTPKKIESFTWEPKPDDDLHSITYQIKTITPIYGGGVEAGEVDKEMPIRAATIRGQLRYWWRFLQSNNKVKPLTGEALYTAECAIWGGMKTNKKDEDKCKKDVDAAGKVKIQVSGIKCVNKKPCGIYTKGKMREDGTFPWRFKFDSKLRLSPYSLFSAQGKSPPNDGSTESPEKAPAYLLLPGLSFTLKLIFRSVLDEDNKKLVEETVRWWVNFGGIGSRTRRGLGAVEVGGIAPLSEEEVEEYGCQLKQRTANQDSITVWNDAVERLYRFRQGRGIGREQGNGNRPGRSNWPEADSIRDFTKNTANGRHMPDLNTACLRPSFPRAMFGLPIIFDFQGAYGEPHKHQLSPAQEGSSRMASPLIIKPVSDGNGKYIPTALLLRKDHLDDLKVKLDEIEDERRSRGDFDRNRKKAWWPSQEKEQNDRAEEIEPMRGRCHDPLQAFLKFFLEE